MEDSHKVLPSTPVTKKFLPLFGAGAFGLALALILTSCGFSEIPPQMAYTTKLSITKPTPQDNQLTCSSENAFRCNLRKFSPHIKNGSFDGEPHCQQIASGKIVCAQVKIFQFDTSETISNCEDCTVNSAQRRYQNTEALCVYQGLIQDNVYSVRGLGENLSEALHKAHQACISSEDLRL